MKCDFRKTWPHLVVINVVATTCARLRDDAFAALANKAAWLYWKEPKHTLSLGSHFITSCCCFFCKYFNFLLEIVRINKKVSNVRAKFDVWSLMYTTDTSVDSFLTAAAPLPVIQTFYSRFLTSFFFEIPLLWYWGKPASHGLRLHGNDNHFSIGFFCLQKRKILDKTVFQRATEA